MRGRSNSTLYACQRSHAPAELRRDWPTHGRVSADDHIHHEVRKLTHLGRDAACERVREKIEVYGHFVELAYLGRDAACQRILMKFKTILHQFEVPDLSRDRLAQRVLMKEKVFPPQKDRPNKKNSGNLLISSLGTPGTPIFV